MVSYEVMTVKDLKVIAKEKGLKGYSTLKKKELISLIKRGKVPKSAKKGKKTNASPKRKSPKKYTGKVLSKMTVAQLKAKAVKLEIKSYNGRTLSKMRKQDLIDAIESTSKSPKTSPSKSSKTSPKASPKKSAKSSPKKSPKKSAKKSPKKSPKNTEKHIERFELHLPELPFLNADLKREDIEVLRPMVDDYMTQFIDDVGEGKTSIPSDLIIPGEFLLRIVARNTTITIGLYFNRKITEKERKNIAKELRAYFLYGLDW